MIGLFRKSAALEEQQQPFVPGRLAGREHVLDARTDVRPDFRPDFTRRPAERPRMLRAERHARIGVVVEERSAPVPIPSTSRSAT